MYRIILKPSTGQWVIQLKPCFFWHTVTTPEPFATYAEAEDYLLASGIHVVYRNWHQRPRFWSQPTA
jgi:hypothetical protein